MLIRYGFLYYETTLLLEKNQALVDANRQNELQLDMVSECPTKEILVWSMAGASATEIVSLAWNQPPLQRFFLISSGQVGRFTKRLSMLTSRFCVTKATEWINCAWRIGKSRLKHGRSSLFFDATTESAASQGGVPKTTLAFKLPTGHERSSSCCAAARPIWVPIMVVIDIESRTCRICVP